MHAFHETLGFILGSGPARPSAKLHQGKPGSNTLQHHMPPKGWSAKPMGCSYWIRDMYGNVTWQWKIPIFVLGKSSNFTCKNGDDYQKLIYRGQLSIHWLADSDTSWARICLPKRAVNKPSLYYPASGFNQPLEKTLAIRGI